VRVSEYSYTLRAWRREVFDYVMDPSFFRMPVCHDMPGVCCVTADGDCAEFHGSRMLYGRTR
jgi:hypothetical protein